MKEVIKNVEIAAVVWGDAHEVWQYVLRAIADAAVETEGKAQWLARTGDDKAQPVADAAGVLRLMVADMADAAGLQTLENRETDRRITSSSTTSNRNDSDTSIGRTVAEWTSLPGR
jgi:hypothetical protein